VARGDMDSVGGWALWHGPVAGERIWCEVVAMGYLVGFVLWVWDVDGAWQWLLSVFLVLADPLQGVCWVSSIASRAVAWSVA
jgi:hypothetical protein